MHYEITIAVARSDILALYGWLDQICPGWYYPADLVLGTGEVRKRNEEFLARNSRPDHIEQVKVVVANADQAMMVKLAWNVTEAKPANLTF